MRLRLLSNSLVSSLSMIYTVLMYSSYTTTYNVFDFRAVGKQCQSSADQRVSCKDL